MATPLWPAKSAGMAARGVASSGEVGMPTGAADPGTLDRWGRRGEPDR